MLEKVYSFRLYIQSRPIWVLSTIALILNLIIWGWILFQIKPVDEPIFISYNILFGVDKIGEWWKLFYLPLFGMGVLVANFLFGWLTFRKDHYFAYLALFIAALIQLYLLISIWVLVFLNV